MKTRAPELSALIIILRSTGPVISQRRSRRSAGAGATAPVALADRRVSGTELGQRAARRARAGARAGARAARAGRVQLAVEALDEVERLRATGSRRRGRATSIRASISGSFVLELRFLGRAAQRQRRRLSAADDLRDPVEVAGTDLALVARGRVAVLPRARTRAPAARTYAVMPSARVAARELEHAGVQRVEAGERDELEAVARARRASRWKPAISASSRVRCAS